MTKLYTPPADLVLKPHQIPTPGNVGVCGLQFAGWGQRQFYTHLAAHRYRGVQIITAAELALHPNHFDFAALTDPDLKQQALDYLMETMRLTNHTLSEVSGHASMMALLCPRGVIHRGFEQFLPGVWTTHSCGEPDVGEMRKKTLGLAEKIFEACVFAGVPVFNLFTGSGRAGHEAVQFPHLGGDQREEIIGKDLEVLGQLGVIATQAGMKELNIENHMEQLFHAAEEMLEFALRFRRDPKLRIFGCKSDMSHVHMTGGYAPDVIRYVTAGLRQAQEVDAAQRLGVGEGMDRQRNDGKSTEADAVRVAVKKEPRWTFFKRMHAKYGTFRLGGSQSTHSRLDLSNRDGQRPNRFGAVDLGGAELWAETMYAYNEHGLPQTCGRMIEHEDDAVVGLTPGNLDVRVNTVFRVAEFVYDYLCSASSTMTHQELMAE